MVPIPRVVQIAEKHGRIRLENQADALIFQSAVCAENVTNSFYSTEKTAYADFSCDFSNVNVLRMEDLYGKKRTAL